jgi:hypothetical protein
MANIKVMIDGELPDEELHRLLKMAGMPIPGAALPPPASDAMIHPIQGNLSPAELARNTINGINPINHLGTFTESEDDESEDDEKDDKDDKKVEEQADYDYGVNPTSRKGFKSGFNPYDYEGTADEPVRAVPAKSGDNPLKGIRSANPHIREDKKLGEYLKEVEYKKGKPFKKFTSKKKEDSKDKKKK